MSQKVKGFSKDPRIRDRQLKTIEAYAAKADFVGNDPERDRLAKIEAIDRSGNRQLQHDDTKVKWFDRLWKSDEARQYMCYLWGIHVDDEPDPVSLMMRTLKEHIVQHDTDKWGKPDRSVSLSAINTGIKLFIPNQTAKVANVHLSGKIERPVEFEDAPAMQSRTILPAGQTIKKPAAPEPDDDEDDDDEE